MLQALFKASFVHIPISVLISALSMLLVMLKSPHVGPIVVPGEFALPRHLIVLPFPGIFLAICPLIRPNSVDLILKEVTLKLRAVLPGKLAFSLLLPVDIVAFVVGSIWPGLCSFSVLLIIVPFSLVSGAFTILFGEADEEACSFCFVIDPISFIDVSIEVD
jgi:hypothetical protein